MSKSLILLDTPVSCKKCPLKSQIHTIHYVCTGAKPHQKMTLPAPDGKPRPSWCPAKDLSDDQLQKIQQLLDNQK